ncbi:MAG: 3-hydroxybutyryl-CoA dehydrogenase, partial [Muriicola sp.]|nr:3-hydroxybutyryl-CoA dehydrogenase [Muriicola sp.]
MKNITVIGAGTMGNGIAHVFAQHNFKVTLVDISEKAIENGMKTIRRNLDRMVQKETLSEEQLNSTLDNLTTSTDLQNAASQAGLVVEAASENLDIKLKIFKDLDSICPPGTILATNTSSISITQIGAATQRPDKVIGMHFMNPVPIMKLVEIIRGYSTSDTTAKTIMELSQKLGKTPTEVNDYPGFVSNRILMPMINEAIETLYNGVAGVEEIDT